MSARWGRSVLALTGASLVASGCLNILGGDIEFRGSGGGSTGGNSTGGNSTGGTGGTSGTGGTGGSAPICPDAGTACTSAAAECPTQTTACITSTCISGCCSTTNASAGTTCTDSGGAVCDGNGACIGCLKDGDCPSTTLCATGTCDTSTHACSYADAAKGTACEGTNNVCDGMGKCVATHCMDGLKDADETDVDCGGSCTTKCADGKACGQSTDCKNNDCYGGTCVSCMDGVKDGTETDIDCGGSCDNQGKTCGFGTSCGTSADCASTFCNSGVCGASVVYTSPPTLGANDLAIDATNAYFISNASTGYAAVKVPLAGGAAVTLASTTTTSYWSRLAIDANDVYLCNTRSNGTIDKVPIAGGAVTNIATGQDSPTALTISLDGVVWINADGSVNSVGVSGGTVTTLAPAGSALTAYGLAVDGNAFNVYFPTSSGLSRVQADGSMAPMQIIAGSPVTDFAVNLTTVFFAQGSVFYSAPRAGGTWTQLFTSPLPPYPFRVVVDTTNIYWIAGAAASETIYRAPLGGGTPVMMASGQPYVAGLAVDSTYLYWISGGMLNKVHK